MSRRIRVRWLVPIAVGGAAALIAAGAVALSDRDGEQSGGTPPASEPATEPTTETVPLDLGPLTDAEARAALGPDLDDIALHYARRIDGPDGSIPVIVGISDNGVTLFSTDELTGVYEAPAPTAAQPIQGVEKPWGPSIGDAIYRDLPGYWKLGGIYRVADDVDRVEIRVGTPDGPEPWRVAEPHAGYVFWAAWFALADYEPGTELTVEWRAYDSDGAEIDPALLPDQPQAVIVPNRS